MPLGTKDQPLRVAIIGSGPSGFYAAEHLLKQDMAVEIDMYDRLPTPYGLVRGGVAPDHQKIKSVTKVYDKTASNPNFHFYGNVEFGTNITHDDLAQHYHAIVYAVGAQTDRKMDIPGEDLPGSYPATEFVAWYNAHPDYRDFQFDLTQESVAVVGLGNVAMDVIRILARTPAELGKTDIADYALEALKDSKVKTIYVLGRRGPAQSAFTNPEIKELGEMEDAEVIVPADDIALDPLSQAYLDSGIDKVAVKNVQILQEYAERGDTGKKIKIVMRFLVSPVELLGDENGITGVKVVKNELYKSDDGSLRPRTTDQYETLPIGLIFRSVGYRGKPLPGVPFYDRWGTIPNDKGRVMTEQDNGEQVVGDYVVGWIKRGPSGIIGTNKPDSVETAKMLLEDMEAGKLWSPENASEAATLSLVRERKPDYVTYQDWKLIDELELELGEQEGRPRKKFTEVSAMLEALKARKTQAMGD
ncbi:MAG: FAD-dependent oxidoreductase [Anaerolineae bacterium]|nr:FAD-dependent oxidoreductase [Anaerolineae bacterium]